MCVCSSSGDALCENKTGKSRSICCVLSVMHHGPVRLTSSVAVAACDDGDGSDAADYDDADGNDNYDADAHYDCW